MSTQEQHEIVRGLHGLYVGVLSEAELKAFDDLCENGLASRSYEGVGGFMGLAKVNCPALADIETVINTVAEAA